ncbi:methylmalonyl Co-A mutase-associated GTPase MeaB [Pallidibacillus thermolactis]|jgi:LAO/AO transport system kinase|uniref:methylmalonyl Co-A mutase-associated GTPase MeaB n=1 Tax=Pallidibacillus thermolactis TaxID=251051 RepID=UPI00156AD96C|nr:methylmalonyl Co-A mutase-associated GTPase MeaB [Pallidibacillus thermolactis]MCU9600296.1 methylmalonyl Co-A mutase-associated GTPase MeaB [Pallidibacillus thermolactis subsp. kokeshiiformis]MED1672612.1 methylmalonyl Co-A mutase-associated GTPase MeaB [Pallidibacillus thermolactis subsp. kokeshiiformis]
MVSNRFRKKKKSIPIQQYVEGIKSGDRMTLAKAITLIESNHPDHFQAGQQLLKEILPLTGKSMRIGITGVPGAGKSTFIERFGTDLCQMGKKVAVLAIDPSSTISQGSILGDKTRMAQLSREENAFIRPSPSGGTLGGVHRKTRETILLCEAAGYDMILVETVGVGQSEVVVRTMVDMFLMLTITGAGDDLQGMKKGMMELVDAIIVTKADGDNKEKAIKTRNEYNQILRLLKAATEGWQTKAVACSSVTGEGISDVWELILDFFNSTKKSGVFYARRKKQTTDWMLTSIRERLEQTFFQNEQIKKRLPVVQRNVETGRLPVSIAVENLLADFFNNQYKE